MLVLKRKIGETIDVGDGTVRITVTDAGDGWAKIGIEADRDIPVHRGEVLKAIQAGIPQEGANNVGATAGEHRAA